MQKSLVIEHAFGIALIEAPRELNLADGVVRLRVVGQEREQEGLAVQQHILHALRLDILM